MVDILTSNQTQFTKPNIPNQIYWIKFTKPILQSRIYKIKSIKQNICHERRYQTTSFNQTNKTKSTQPILPNQI